MIQLKKINEEPSASEPHYYPMCQGKECCRRESFLDLVRGGVLVGNQTT